MRVLEQLIGQGFGAFHADVHGSVLENEQDWPSAQRNGEELQKLEHGGHVAPVVRAVRTMSALGGAIGKDLQKKKKKSVAVENGRVTSSACCVADKQGSTCAVSSHPSVGSHPPLSQNVALRFGRFRAVSSRATPPGIRSWNSGGCSF